MPTKPTKSLLCNAKYCHFCGYGSDWEVFRASNMARHMETHHSTAEECIGPHFNPPTRRNQTWRVLDETHPELIVCIAGENGNTVSAVYCLDCNHMEQMSDESEGRPLVRFPTHKCPTPHGPSKLKGTKRIKATEPAAGGAGTAPAPAPATKGWLFTAEWMKAHKVDIEGNVYDNLEEDLKARDLAWDFEKAAKAALAREQEAMKQLAALKSATPVASSATVDLSTAAEMVADALCLDSDVGRIVSAEKKDLETDIAEDLSNNPIDYEPYTAYKLLTRVAKSVRTWRMACKKARDEVETAEQTVRLRDGELARLTVSNSKLIGEIGYRERDVASLTERVRQLEVALAAAQKEQAPTPA